MCLLYHGVKSEGVEVGLMEECVACLPFIQETRVCHVCFIIIQQLMFAFSLTLAIR